MGAPLLHAGAQVTCPHGGQVTMIPGSSRVMVAGHPVVTLADSFPISGCPFEGPRGDREPCRTLQWHSAAARVRVEGWPVIPQHSSGVCLSEHQHPAGSPVATTATTRVFAI